MPRIHFLDIVHIILRFLVPRVGFAPVELLHAPRNPTANTGVHGPNRVLL